MPDKDIILAKVAIIQKCLKRIQATTNLIPDSLDDINNEDIFVLNLQRAVQAAIDLATHIVASEGLGLSETIKENFTLLKNAHIINQEIMQKMEAMTGFRNIAIYDYQAINKNILKSILSMHLKDLEDYYTSILIHFNIIK